MVGTIRFELRNGVATKDERLPISLIYSVKGQRKRFSTGELVSPINWNNKERIAIYVDHKKKGMSRDLSSKILSKVEVDDINNVLFDLKRQIEKIEDWFQSNEIPFSSQNVIEKLKANQIGTTRKEEQTGLVFEYIEQYILSHEATREPGSLTVYKSINNHLKAFQDLTGQKVSFESIDYNFFHRFQTFLINRTKTDKAGVVSPLLNNTTIAKALSTLKTFLSYARREGIKVNDSYRDFTIKKEKLEVIALDQDEFDSIIELDLRDNNRLIKARDIFCLSCSTGLRYSDISQLRREHINDEIISLNIKKTKSQLNIPLNTISAGIIAKYQHQKTPLPMVSNQNLNYAIKDLCKLAGIDKPIEIVRFSGRKRIIKIVPKYDLIHFHTARKTFVTLSLEKGMNAEEIMQITGHSDYKSFKRYVTVTEKRKKVVMLKAWGAPRASLKVV